MAGAEASKGRSARPVRANGTREEYLSDYATHTCSLLDSRVRCAVHASVCALARENQGLHCSLVSTL